MTVVIGQIMNHVCIQKAMGSKGLWRHIEGKAVAPKPYALVNNIAVLSDGKTSSTKEQIEVRETRIIEFDKWEYLAQHVILSTTSTHLGVKIKDVKSAEEMWNAVGRCYYQEHALLTGCRGSAHDHEAQ